ncbi:MAG: lysophospholipid acyltransferase family protein [Anaerolineae bacterium]|nr:lysophospholipid acyltransferase family protein [Anaerolineae bacterium]
MTWITKGDLPFLAYSAATVATRAVPLSYRRRWTIPVADRLGGLWRLADRSAAALGRRNMQAIMGDRLNSAEIDTALREHFNVIVLGKLLNDMLPDLTLEQLEQFLRLEGREHLDAALAKDQGVLLLGAHYGLHGYVPLTLYQRLGLPFNTVVGAEFPIDSWVYNRFVHPVRSRNWHELPVIDNTHGNPQRAMLRCLQAKKSLLIWPDLFNDDLFELSSPQVLRMPLLGHTLPFRTGTFQLAQWTQVPTLPFFILPRADGGFVMRVEPPLTIVQEKSIDGLYTNVLGYVQRLERHIAAHPGLWWQWRQPRLLEIMHPAKPLNVASETGIS